MVRRRSHHQQTTPSNPKSVGCPTGRRYGDPNGAYGVELPRGLTVADLPMGNPRIVRRLEQYFRDNNIAAGEFNHYLPAAYFLGEQTTLLARLDGATLERTETLFRRVNELLARA
jgi:hypothetical protein